MTSGPATATREVRLRDVEEVVGAWCDRVDPDRLTGVEAAEGVARLAVLGRRVAAKQAALAARAAQCRAYPGGSRSSENWLAKQNGISCAAAKKALDTAKRLKDCPQTAAAFGAGALSVDEASEITAAVVLDPAAEAALVAKATSTHDLGEVRDAADRVKRAARSGEDPALRRARLRAGRKLKNYPGREGHVGIDAWLVPDEWAAVAMVLDAFTDAQFQAARRDGTRDTYEAYRADALLALFAVAGAAIGLTFNTGRAPTASAESPRTAADTATDADAESSGPAAGLATLMGRVPERVNWNVCVLVDGIALKRGYPSGDEVCEIPGVGLVDVPWIRSLLDDAVVDVLVHDRNDITAYGTLTRHKPKPVKLALAARDRRCVVPGCRRTRRVQADHRHDHAKGGPTTTANLSHLCQVHHDQKTHRGARLERTDTHWHWYPPPPKPGEPDHPPGSIPWIAAIGEHLPAWDLTDLPGHEVPPGGYSEPAGSPGDDRLPFG